jgi:hypothetical protein
MKWSDIPLNPSARMLRQFAVAWLIFFLGLGVHQFLVRGHHGAGLGLGALALLVGGPGLARPMALRWLFVGWMILAFPIGWLISLLMLWIMFYCIITPVALIFRLRGRDLLARKPAQHRASFWTDKNTPEDVSRYFRQY